MSAMDRTAFSDPTSERSGAYTSASGTTDLTPSRASGWVGWIVFAAVMMVISGTFSIIWGIIALVRDQVFVVRPTGNVVNLDYTTWGWIQLILGCIVVAVGLALLTGNMFARIVTVILATLSAISHLLVLKSYPVWSVIVIAVDILVIYATTVHGRELRQN